MNLLLRSVQIIDKASPWNGQIKDIRVEDNRIAEIGENLSAAGMDVVEGNNCCISPGWLDMRVASRDPGFEHKEDLDSVRQAAMQGGFTEIVLLPNSQPVVDSKDTLNYVRQRRRQSPVCVHVAAAVTKHAAGTDFTEMIDLHTAGAVAFTDGDNPIQHADIFLKTLLYLRPMNALLINRPEDKQLTLFGQMNEGLTSTLLGLKGMPPLAEEMMLTRDLNLLKYILEQTTEPATLPLLHISLVSTARSVELIREAKKQGLPVSCEVAAHQLVYHDEALLTFDTNLKVNPPFRKVADIQALRDGLVDGTIDCVVSDHCPHDEESKNLEFDHAEFGITGLETVFALLTMHSGLSVESIVEKLTSEPRRILRLPALSIAEGQTANFTFFDPAKEWTYTKSASKAINSPFLGKTLKGHVSGVLNQGHIRWFGQPS
ncbi:dihydroorotase [Arundinibacter roseus]|uniref:Dihydroorotase n=1 Tax=Arundinibacter roseus TaxID=2070510 RepID=A0A4R4KGU4_9BACT|nr:dihydroorotase [Arundinibacter roseus]TDB65801.1 dihydroorotase [Arundinibacter roseus]